MDSIAQRLNLLREKYNFSKSDIARQLGVTPALISAYENQDRKPRLITKGVEILRKHW